MLTFEEEEGMVFRSRQAFGDHKDRSFVGF